LYIKMLRELGLLTNSQDRTTLESQSLKTERRIPMSIEENKALADRWFDEVWNKVNLTAVDELCTTNFTFSYAEPGVSND